MDELFEELNKIAPTSRDQSLAKMTTLQIGGIAKYVTYPETDVALDTIMRLLKEKNIPLLDQVIEDNQIGDKKVKKRDLKKVFDYFKKDQTVVIGYKSIPRSLLGISVLSLFISG